MNTLQDRWRDHETLRQIRRFQKARLPRWVAPALIALVVISWIPLVFIARAWVTTTTQPRIQIFPDMDQQPRFKAQVANPFFADNRTMRLPIMGTVAQGERESNPHLHEGKIGGEWATTFPLEVTHEVMQRGQERFGVFCAPCHGLAGAGDGIISLRAEQLGEGTWIPPLSFHTATVRGRTVGELFNSITHGIRTMPAYRPQIMVTDRWAIVAYLRALQRSRYAKPEDVPADKQEQIR